eukprot:scaffold3317_cov80-Phaeocystis_antarctica.AAC.1
MDASKVDANCREDYSLWQCDTNGVPNCALGCAAALLGSFHVDGNPMRIELSCAVITRTVLPQGSQRPRAASVSLWTLSASEKSARLDSHAAVARQLFTYLQSLLDSTARLSRAPPSTMPYNVCSGRGVVQL